MSMFQDNDDLNIHDDGEDSPVASQGAWPAFSSAPASASLKPGAGIQVSALGQLLGGHNGNIASMVSGNTELGARTQLVLTKSTWDHCVGSQSGMT